MPLVLKEKAAIAIRSIVGSPQPRTRWGYAKAESKIQRLGARVIERKAEVLLVFVGAWFETGLRIRALASKGRHKLVDTAGEYTKSDGSAGLNPASCHMGSPSAPYHSSTSKLSSKSSLSSCSSCLANSRKAMKVT